MVKFSVIEFLRTYPKKRATSAIENRIGQALLRTSVIFSSNYVAVSFVFFPCHIVQSQNFHLIMEMNGSV